MLKNWMIVIFTFASFSIAAGEKVRPFELPYYEKNEVFKLSDHMGKKQIVLNFWASWCTSCIEELPLLKALKQKYPQALFIAINSGERKKLVKKFLKKYYL